MEWCRTFSKIVVLGQYFERVRFMMDCTTYVFSMLLLLYFIAFQCYNWAVRRKSAEVEAAHVLREMRRRHGRLHFLQLVLVYLRALFT